MTAGQPALDLDADVAVRDEVGGQRALGEEQRVVGVELLEADRRLVLAESHPEGREKRTSTYASYRTVVPLPKSGITRNSKYFAIRPCMIDRARAA